jgi:hypothetical protein
VTEVLLKPTRLLLMQKVLLSCRVIMHAVCMEGIACWCITFSAVLYACPLACTGSYSTPCMSCHLWLVLSMLLLLFAVLTASCMLACACLCAFSKQRCRSHVNTLCAFVQQVYEVRTSLFQRLL